MRKFFPIAAIVMIAMLAITLPVSILIPDRDYSPVEKRNLAKMPSLSWEAVKSGTYMDDIESYLADQFPGRDALVGCKARLDILLGKNKLQDVYICSNGSLIEDFQETSRTTTDNTIAAIDAFAEKYPDSSMYMMLVPNAVSIYSDRLPKDAVTADQNEYIDHFYEGISANVTTVDVRTVLQENRDKFEIYYKTDHHWTTDAAALAAEELCSIMEVAFPEDYELGIVTNDFTGSLAAKIGYNPGVPDAIKIAYPADGREILYTVETADGKKSSLYDTEALTGDDPYQVFFGGNAATITIETANPEGGSLLVFKDSYANCLLPFLLENYSKIKIVDPRYYYDNIDLEMQVGKYDDVLFLYNVNTLSQDANLMYVLQNQQ